MHLAGRECPNDVPPLEHEVVAEVVAAGKVNPTSVFYEDDGPGALMDLRQHLRANEQVSRLPSSDHSAEMNGVQLAPHEASEFLIPTPHHKNGFSHIAGHRLLHSRVHRPADDTVAGSHSQC